MKRVIIALFMFLATTSTLWAQSGLPIDGLFHGKFKDAPGSTEIVVTGDKAASMGLAVYRSLTVGAGSEAAHEVRRIVTQQGTQAVSREVEYRRGNIYYGYYVLPSYTPTGKRTRLNRYVFFLDQSLNTRGKANQMIVIYMESTADSETIKKLIRQ